MSRKTITMRKIKEVLRLRLACGLSFSEIARALQLSKGVAAKYVELAHRRSLDWNAIAALDEAQLSEQLLPQYKVSQRASQYAPPDFAQVHQELKNKCMTLQLLWQEYVASASGKTYSYSAFCEHYSRFTKTLKLSMRQAHKAGEKMFVDYAGPTIPIIDPLTGQITKAQIFVAVLGASHYTFALATKEAQIKSKLV